MFHTLSWNFRPNFGLLLKLGAPKNPENWEHFFVRLKFSHCFAQKLNFERKSCNKAFSNSYSTFPLLLKVALGKQGISLPLIMGITRNLSPKNSKFPLFFGILCQFSSGCMDTLLVKLIFFLKAWPVYNKVKANTGFVLVQTHLCIVNNFYTYLATDTLHSLNTVLFFLFSKIIRIFSFC